MHSENFSDLPRAILDFLWSPFRTVKYFVRDLSATDDRLVDDSIVIRILALASMPFHLLGGLISLIVQNWPTSRSGIAAIAAIPAAITLMGLLSAWVLADYVRSDARRILFYKSALQFNIQNFPDVPESALAFAQRLVEIDPNDTELKFKLGLAQQRADNDFLANDIMKSIAPDDTEGYLEAHNWRATYLVRKNKTAEELKAIIGLAEKHLKMITTIAPDRLIGKARLASLYMTYANLLDDQSPECLEYLVKADELFREIIDKKNPSSENRSVQITNLSPSVLVRKQLAAIDPETYSIEAEVVEVRHNISELLKTAIRFYPDSLQLWLLLIQSASEIRQFDFAIEIADIGIKNSSSPETAIGISKAKSRALRKAAVSINKFDDFTSYRNRFIYLCDAVRAAPAEASNYIFLLEFVGNENPKPTIELARQLGLAESGDAVPIKIEWLRQSCVETKYTGFLCTMIGVHEFHLGNNESAIENWSVAQQFDPTTRDFISLLLESIYYAKKLDKFDNFETMLSESLLIYPEAARIQLLRGRYYFKEQKFQKAIDDFRALLTTHPTQLALHHKIKTCYQLMGQRRAADDEQKILDIKIQQLPKEKQIEIRETLRQLDAKPALL